MFIAGGNEAMPDYPYITFQASTPHTTQQTALNHSDEIYQIAFTVNCYSNLPEDVMNMQDDIQTCIHDPEYRQLMDRNGVTVVNCVPSGDSLSNFASLLDVSAQSLTLTVRIRRIYKSKYFTITNTNLGGKNNG